jgi:hypothetical protein
LQPFNFAMKAKLFRVGFPWISLDFLGFSRPNRDLSMGYSGQTATKFFLAPPHLEAPRGRDFRMGDARRWSFRKVTTISDFLQSIA